MIISQVNAFGPFRICIPINQDKKNAPGFQGIFGNIINGF